MFVAIAKTGDFVSIGKVVAFSVNLERYFVFHCISFRFAFFKEGRFFTSFRRLSFFILLGGEICFVPNGCHLTHQKVLSKKWITIVMYKMKHIILIVFNTLHIMNLKNVYEQKKLLKIDFFERYTLLNEYISNHKKFNAYQLQYEFKLKFITEQFFPILNPNFKM